MSDYPLGPPTNRKPVGPPAPVPGRPNWFYDKAGKPYYVEPPKADFVDIPLTCP